MINLVPALLDQSNLLRYQAKEREKCGSERINNGQVFVRHSGYAMLSFMPALVCRVARIFCTDHLVHKAVPENGAHRLDLQVVQIRLPLGAWCRQSTHAQSRDVLMQPPCGGSPQHAASFRWHRPRANLQLSSNEFREIKRSTLNNEEMLDEVERHRPLNASLHGLASPDIYH